MRAIIVAGVIGLLATGAAQAACPTAPDGSSSDYVNNGTQRSLCLQQELAGQLALRQQIQAQTDAAMARIEMDMKLQQMQRQMRDAQQSFMNP
ncbi:hypothetical protein GCM10011321_25730 [Youhaiella tibetensis]|uniref:Uncharacterized protein n=1 Tax=Paradevosia tibetensis TaxID=1447062 RepID=A0A5B9DJU1_9HYPH|nr:hypothetical protein [Youhaiella tibetensis]QEE19413.1 hypothetical protein FNA67_04145 [Youhaiella tibetensis]GGF33406.1 hypothetical protein GCM10011321_25730 [Youhaiella tibetensis]